MSENNKRWISRLRNGLGKSSNRLVDGISSIFSDRPIDAKTLEELEDLLISADLGVDTAKKFSWTNTAKKIVEAAYGD